VLSKFLESLYNKVFVNIVVKSKTSDVYMELCSKNKVIDGQQITFSTTSTNDKMINFISSYTKETPYFYISILDMSFEQGAIPTCDKNSLSTYCDLSTSEYKCHDTKWTYYTSKTNLYDVEKRYREIGVDFIFSPFTILSEFFKDKIDSGIALYVLIQETYISLCVFENSQLLFAETLRMKSSLEEEDTHSEDDDDNDPIEIGGIDLDGVDVLDDMDGMDDLDDFSDIEDLDSIEDIDEFSEHKDIEEEFYESDEVLSKSSSEDTFTEDYERFTNIQHSLRGYYKNSKYKSAFVESIYIADAVGVSGELKKFLEEEMFLSVYIRHINLGEQLTSLAKKELKL